MLEDLPNPTFLNREFPTGVRVRWERLVPDKKGAADPKSDPVPDQRRVPSPDLHSILLIYVHQDDPPLQNPPKTCLILVGLHSHQNFDKEREENAELGCIRACLTIYNQILTRYDAGKL